MEILRGYTVQSRPPPITSSLQPPPIHHHQCTAAPSKPRHLQPPTALPHLLQSIAADSPHHLHCSSRSPPHLLVSFNIYKTHTHARRRGRERKEEEEGEKERERERAGAPPSLSHPNCTIFITSAPSSCITDHRRRRQICSPLPPSTIHLHRRLRAPSHCRARAPLPPDPPHPTPLSSPSIPHQTPSSSPRHLVAPVSATPSRRDRHQPRLRARRRPAISLPPDLLAAANLVSTLPLFLPSIPRPVLTPSPIRR